MKQVFNLVKLFLVILLVSFTSCTNDLSEKDSQMSFSFTLPQEKVSRTTGDNNVSTLWNVTAVIENKKDIIQKIEQSGYSGETVTITFNQIIIGQKVRINIDLTQDGETTPSYTGSSDWFIVKKDENKINISLNKVTSNENNEPPTIVDAAEPQINVYPTSKVEIATENNSQEELTETLSVNATSTDGGTLSFIWQEKNPDNTWQKFEPITTTTDSDRIESSIKVTVNKGQSRTFKCIITNTNNSVNGNKTATIETNEVTVAYVEGALTSITAQYTGKYYETFGSDFTYGNVTVTEKYTNASNNVTTDVTVTAYDSRYTISPTNNDEKAIGFVPYTVSCIYNATVTTNLTVPVKYELSAGDFVIKGSNQNNGNPEKIAQFTGNTTLQVATSETSNIPNEIYNYENSVTAEYYDILEKLQSEWKQDGTSIQTPITVNNRTYGTYQYTNTLTVPTENSWCVGEIELEYEVEVCPWTLAVNSNDGNSVEDLQNLTGDTTYTLSAKNEALEATTTTYITWESDKKNSFVVENDNLTTPEATTSDQTAIITAKVGNTTIGSVEVTVQGKQEYDAIVSSWYDLNTKIVNIPENIYTEEKPYVIAINNSDEYNVSYCINVTKPVKIIPLENVTITRSGTKEEFFYTTAYFEIAGTPTAKITLNGNNNINAQQPIIKATSSLTLSYCDFNNNVNTSTDGGAIYVNKNDTSTINVNLSNCNFNNNFVTNTVNGGAVALYGKSIISQINNCTFTNNNATNGGGGAIYLETNGTSPTNNINTITNCTFTNNTSSSNGSAIYLKKGHIILEGTTISNNLYLDSVQYTYCTFKGNNNLHCVDFKVSYGGAFSEITIDDTFDTSSVISINIVNKENISSSNPLKFTNTNIENDIINCFKITDEEGTSWTLNSDGTITEATTGGSGGTQLSGTPVTSETQLLDALSGTAEIIIIENDITLTGSNYLVIENKTVQIAANKNVKITQTQTNTGEYNLIWVKSGGNLTLGGGAGMLTLQGNSTATGPLIYMNGNELTLTENCKLTGVSNNTAANAILILKGEFNMTGGEITENTAGSAINTNKNSQTGNITMNISGGKIYNNSGASNGGAINIVNASSYSTTVNIYGTAEIYNNTAKTYGGSIFMTGSNNTLNVNPSTENDKVKMYDNKIGNTNQSASIYITNGSTFYLNGNKLTLNLTPYSSNINKP